MKPSDDVLWRLNFYFKVLTDATSMRTLKARFVSRRRCFCRPVFVFEVFNEHCVVCLCRYELNSDSTVDQDEEEVLLAVYMRERSNYRDYGSGGNSYNTSLFGHPLLMTLPRAQCTRDDLYQIFLQRLT